MQSRRFSSRHLAAAAAHLLDAAVVLLLAAVVAVTTAQVVARYLIGVSLPWSEELNRLLFVWMVMIAAVGAPHMRIGLLAERLPLRARRGLTLLLSAISILLLGVLINGALVLVELTAYDRYTALRISVQYLFLAPVVGGALWLLVVAREGLFALRGHEPAEDQTGQ